MSDEYDDIEDLDDDDPGPFAEDTRDKVTKYKPAIHAQLILWMSRSGLTGEEIAAELGISKKTLYTWKKTHQEVDEALSRGRDWFDATVETRLYQNATGFKTTAKHQEFAIDPTTGERTLVSETVNVNEHPPNTTAQIFWLKNRQPTKWRDKHEVDLSADISIGLPPKPEDAYADEDDEDDAHRLLDAPEVDE
jgi:hypothetical protein